MLTPKTYRLVIIAACLLVFILSLFFEAFTVDNNENESAPGFFWLIIGATAVLGGGLAEWFIWLANPLLLSAIILFYNNNRKSRVTGFIALVLALLFLTWKRVLTSESGHTDQILALQTGYYLWLASIAILNIGMNFYFANTNRPGSLN